MSVLIQSRYSRRPAAGLSFDDSSRCRSRAKQSFAKEADINHIMARYMKTGILVDPALAGSARRPMYGDFFNSADFLAMQNSLACVRSVFDQLPASVRAEFSNDAARMLDFISDPANLDRAISLGLLAESDRPSKPLSPADGQSATGTPVNANPAAAPSGAPAGVPAGAVSAPSTQPST